MERFYRMLQCDKGDMILISNDSPNEAIRGQWGEVHKCVNVADDTGAKTMLWVQFPAIPDLQLVTEIEVGIIQRTFASKE